MNGLGFAESTRIRCSFPWSIPLVLSDLAGLRLPFYFDPARLKHDLSLIGADEWSPHYNERDFGGEWQGVALRSLAGSERDLFAGAAVGAEFRDTPLLERCLFFREVLAALSLQLKSVRLLSLAPGSFIREHCDKGLGFEDGEVRIHVPIATNSRVEFYVSGEQLALDEGGCYYVNVHLPHRVVNRGPAARVHMVIDAIVDDRVRALFERCVAEGRHIPRSSGRRLFAEFTDLVFSDAALLRKLRSLSNKDDLVKTIVEEAENRGVPLNEGDIEATVRSEAAVAPSPGWIPVETVVRGPDLYANFLYDPDFRFTESFFNDSIRTSLQSPFTARFRREMLLGTGPEARPAGFIFHMSRCGSTLISRSLAAVESVLAISEPAPVDEVVQTGCADWLKSIVSALGCVRGAPARRYIVKLDCWHIHSLPLFRAAFPNVPWIFVFRDPKEVLVSWLRSPGIQALPGAMDPARIGMRFEDITSLTREQWGIRVIEGFMTAALGYRRDPLALYVDYGELPAAICTRIAEHLDLRLTPRETEQVNTATAMDAKNPGLEFKGDRDEKRRLAESLQPDPGLARLSELYRELADLSRSSSS